MAFIKAYILCISFIAICYVLQLTLQFCSIHMCIGLIYLESWGISLNFSSLCYSGLRRRTSTFIHYMGLDGLFAPLRAPKTDIMPPISGMDLNIEAALANRLQTCVAYASQEFALNITNYCLHRLK